MKKFQKRFIIFVSLIAVLFFIGRFSSIDADKVDAVLSKVPLVYSSLIFIVFYIIGTFFLWQLKDPLKIVGAVAFGAYLSTLLIYIAEIFNASIFFGLSRILGKDWVEKSLKGKSKSIYTKLENTSMGWIFALRLIPLVPYRVLDLSFGLSRISFKKYMIAVVLASPLRIFWIQFILAAVKGFSFEKVIAYFMQNQLIFLWSLIYSIFAIILAFAIQKKLKASR